MPGDRIDRLEFATKTSCVASIHESHSSIRLNRLRDVRGLNDQRRARFGSEY